MCVLVCVGGGGKEGREGVGWLVSVLLPLSARFVLPTRWVVKPPRCPCTSVTFALAHASSRDALLVFQTDNSGVYTGFTLNYAASNPAPTSITPTSFSVPENSPAGFTIGTFTVTGRF